MKKFKIVIPIGLFVMYLVSLFMLILELYTYC